MKSAVAFALAWLAAWCQVVLVATMSWSALAASLNPLGDVPVCHSDAEQEQQPSHAPDNGHDCGLCAVCQSHGPSAIVPAPAAVAPEPRRLASVHFAMPQSRAPPPLRLIAAQQRGPPSPI